MKFYVEGYTYLLENLALILCDTQHLAKRKHGGICFSNVSVSHSVGLLSLPTEMAFPAILKFERLAKAQAEANELFQGILLNERSRSWNKVIADRFVFIDYRLCKKRCWYFLY